VVIGHQKKTRNDTIHEIISRNKSVPPYFNLNRQELFLEAIQDFHKYYCFLIFTPIEKVTEDNYENTILYCIKSPTGDNMLSVLLNK